MGGVEREEERGEEGGWGGEDESGGERRGQKEGGEWMRRDRRAVMTQADLEGNRLIPVSHSVPSVA